MQAHTRRRSLQARMRPSPDTKSARALTSDFAAPSCERCLLFKPPSLAYSCHGGQSWLRQDPYDTSICIWEDNFGWFKNRMIFVVF